MTTLRKKIALSMGIYSRLRQDLKDCDSILELGCGPNSLLLSIGAGPRTTAIDIFQPYVDEHRKAGSYLDCRQGDIRDAKFVAKSFDAVVMTDVLEHIARPDVEACGLFENVEKWARKKVIILVPNGFFENDKLDGNSYQEHKSAWELEDFTSRGYKVQGMTGFRFLYGQASLPRFKPSYLWFLVGLVTSPLVRNWPRIAWHLYARKDLDNR